MGVIWCRNCRHGIVKTNAGDWIHLNSLFKIEIANHKTGDIKYNGSAKLNYICAKGWNKPKPRICGCNNPKPFRRGDSA